MPVKTKDELKVDINATIEDNVSGKVSPADIRDNLINIVDSIQVIVSDEDIETDNFSTPDNRNTRAGNGALDSVHLENHTTEDNSAFGYNSLYSNYTGTANSAFGAYSASSNVYGSGNSAFGYAALASNVNGDDNTAIGKNSLYFNKYGDFNVALGHAAGYYIGENDSYKLYIGAHNVDQSGMCEFPDGKAEFVPAVYGDLLNAKLGVGTNELNPEGRLQVDGDFTPVNSDRQDSLGTKNYGWKEAHVDAIVPDTQLTVEGDIVPKSNMGASLGSPSLMYENVYAENLVITGTSSITETVVTYNNFSQFPDKIFYLASSGINENTQGPGAYLTDEGIDGAGFVVQSSGIEYTRSYGFQFSSPDLNADFLEEDSVYSRAAWNSNISLEIESGRHVKTDRVLGRDSLNLLNTISGCQGIFIGQDIVLGREEDRDEYLTWNSSGDINAFALPNSGFVYNTFARDSNVTIESNWYSRHTDSDNLYGFSQKYIDAGDTNDRFVLSSLNAGDTSGVFVMARDTGFVGVDNTPYGMDFVPQTNFNVNSSGDSTLRINGEDSARLEFSVGDNSLDKGFSINYLDASSRAQFRIHDGAAKTIMQIVENGVSINSLSTNASLTVGADSDDQPSIAIAQTIDEVSHVAAPGFLHIYARPTSGELNRTQSLYFKDDGGNEFDVLSSFYDAALTEFVYTDSSGNTLIGDSVVENRNNVSGVRNTADGEGALYNLDGGDDNIAIGYYSGSGIVDGSRNIIIGNGGNVTNPDNLFYLGHTNNGEVPLMSGEIPESGETGRLHINSELELNNLSRVDSINISQVGKDTVINKTDTGSPDFPDSSLIFRFTGTNLDQDVVTIIPNNKYLTPGNYYEEPVERSIMELRGDLNLRGAIHFADGTRLDTFTEQTFTPSTGIAISSGDYSYAFALDFEGLPEFTESTDDSLIAISNSGEIEKVNLQEFAQRINSSNPQTFFTCKNGYNLVLSNDTFVDHTQNCTVTYIGRDTGRDGTGFTNTVMIGPEAGYEATAFNPDLDFDIGSVFIGYRAGRSSTNSDSSVFIGPSAGQDANADNSVFIGNSAGQSSQSEKSIGIGDNALDSVTGSNNIEILGERNLENTLINGNVSDRVNIGGIVAGNANTGRVSVGGNARIQPNAAMEVRAKAGTVRLQEWFNSNGDLVAYLDENGNMKIAGTLEQNATL